MAKRPGRKRKATTDRSMGRIVQAQKPDRGTPELQQRREYLAQQGDPVKTAYPLGILWANGQVTDDEHLAGCKYAYLHAVIYGRESVAAVRYGLTVAGRDEKDETDPEYIRWIEGIKAQLRNATKAMDAVSRQHRDALVNLVVYERAPCWMLPRIPSLSDLRDGKRFAEAIRALAVAMASGKKRAA